MSHSYIVILVLYALASFGALLAIGEALLWLARKPLLKAVDRFRPQDGVVAYVVLQALPSVLAFLLTAISAVPGYFQGEPMGTHEEPGFALIGLAFIGLYASAAPLFRASAMLYRTHLRTRRWLSAEVASEKFSDIPVVEVGAENAFVVAAGMLRKRIFVSSLVRRLLSKRELHAVLRHETAHCHQNHNVVRFLAALTPRVFKHSDLEEKFSEMIEYAADDAVLDEPADALNLAAAVVVLARQSAVSAGLLYSALVGTLRRATLERRVERLVLPRTPLRARILGKLVVGCGALLMATALIGSLPLAQAGFRETLELLVR